MFDVTAFRVAFPEFSDATAYPDAMLNYYGAISDESFRDSVYGNLVEHVRFLYVAHSATIARQNVRTSSTGMIPGTSAGIISSKSVGSASVSYDTSDTTIANADVYNLSIYGKTLYHYMHLYGAGCVQI